MSDKIKTIREALEKLRRKHDECEDCWYSCPKSEDGCCNDAQGDECNCGADKHNAILDTALSALDQLAPTAEKVKAGDRMRNACHHIACQLIHPKLELTRHGDLETFISLCREWDAAKSQPSLDITEAIKAFSFIKEIGERDWSTRRLNTCEDRVKSMVKWANHGIASLTQQPK